MQPIQHNYVKNYIDIITLKTIIT